MAKIVESGMDHEQAMANVFHAVGRSVVMYQVIERQLKVLLPNLGVEEADASINPFEEMKRLSESKTTMGPLFERFKNSVNSSHPEGFSAYLHQVVDNRNELIHKFTSLSFGKLATVEHCNEALLYLNDRQKYAQPLSEMINGLLLSFVEFVTDLDTPKLDAKNGSE